MSSMRMPPMCAPSLHRTPSTRRTSRAEMPTTDMSTQRRATKQETRTGQNHRSPWNGRGAPPCRDHAGNRVSAVLSCKKEHARECAGGVVDVVASPESMCIVSVQVLAHAQHRENTTTCIIQPPLSHVSYITKAREGCSAHETHETSPCRRTG